MTRTLDPAANLDARYGRTRDARRRRLRLGIAAAAVLTVALVAWLLWVIPGKTDPSVQTQDTGYQKVGDDQVRVRWELTVDPGTATRCAVQALDGRFGIVGWKVVDVPPSGQQTRAIVETVRTVSPASSGLISRCWVP